MAGMSRPDPDTPARRAPRTVIGNLDAVHLASVDRVGRVHLDGVTWSLEWWIGAEDRWHLPGEEAAVRQGLVGSAPVVETRMRVPGGDAVHRAYAARDAGGRSVVVVEVENRSTVPFAVALAVRPEVLDGPGTVREVSAEGTELRVDGELVLVAARAPGRRVAAAAGDRSVAEVVRGGDAAPAAVVSATCEEGRAEAALLFPLAHTATLRVVLPQEGGPIDADALPSAEQVASGWRTHARRGARVEVPDPRVQAAVDANVCHLLLRPHGGRIAAALDRYGFAEEAAATLLGDPDATLATSTPGEVLLALSAHWTLTRDVAFARAATPLAARLVSLLGQSPASTDLALGGIAAPGAAAMLDAVGEARAAEDVRAAGRAMAAAAANNPPPPAPPGVAPVEDLLGKSSSTFTWVGPQDGHEPGVAAALLVAVRGMLVNEHDGVPPALALAPTVPPGWFGRGWEVHDLPTAYGRLSYAVRWHADRPALLWDLAPHDDGPVRLVAPLLDPTWSTLEARGETLLGPVVLPEAPSGGVVTPVTLDPPPERT